MQPLEQSLRESIACCNDNIKAAKADYNNAIGHIRGMRDAENRAIEYRVDVAHTALTFIRFYEKCKRAREADLARMEAIRPPEV